MKTRDRCPRPPLTRTTSEGLATPTEDHFTHHNAPQQRHEAPVVDRYS